MGNEGAEWPFIWGLCRPFSSLAFIFLPLNPGLVTSGSFCLVRLILSCLLSHQHSSFQLLHPKLGHIPEGQIKGPQLLLSAFIRPQLRRGAHPSSLPWPLHPVVPTLGFQRPAHPKVVPADAERALPLQPHPLFSEEERMLQMPE